MIDNILGNKAAMKIVRFLYASPNRFFSFLEMEKFLGVGREGMRQTLRKLEYANMVYTEKKGGKRYKLILDNPMVERLCTVFDYEKRFVQGIAPKKLTIIANMENDCIKLITGLQGIWLFGSVAKGKAKEGSDIDLLIIVEKNSPIIKTTLEEIKEKYEKKYRIQTILMDTEEFNKRKKEQLLQEIRKTGIALHEI